MNMDNNRIGTRPNQTVPPRQGRSNGPGPMPGTMPLDMQGPPAVTDRQYIPGYLASLIGRTIRAEFLVGTNSFIDRTGVLREVGVNYFVLEDTLSRQLVMCDLYSVKFVTVLS